MMRWIMCERAVGGGGRVDARARAIWARVGWLGNPTSGETLFAGRRARARRRATLTMVRAFCPFAAAVVTTAKMTEKESKRQQRHRKIRAKVRVGSRRRLARVSDRVARRLFEPLSALSREIFTILTDTFSIFRSPERLNVRASPCTDPTNTCTCK